MTYELAFLDISLKEWEKLDRNIQTQFKKKLEERLETPRVKSAKLHGHEDRYKIKLRSIGYARHRSRYLPVWVLRPPAFLPVRWPFS